MNAVGANEEIGFDLLSVSKAGDYLGFAIVARVQRVTQFDPRSRQRV